MQQHIQTECPVSAMVGGIVAMWHASPDHVQVIIVTKIDADILTTQLTRALYPTSVTTTRTRTVFTWKRCSHRIIICHDIDSARERRIDVVWSDVHVTVDAPLVCVVSMPKRCDLEIENDISGTEDDGSEIENDISEIKNDDLETEDDGSETENDTSEIENDGSETNDIRLEENDETKIKSQTIEKNDSNINCLTITVFFLVYFAVGGALAMWIRTQWW